MPLSEALALMEPSKEYVDEWQQVELQSCGGRREVPVVTIELLRELRALGTMSAVRDACISSTTGSLTPTHPP